MLTFTMILYINNHLFTIFGLFFVHRKRTEYLSIQYSTIDLTGLHTNKLPIWMDRIFQLFNRTSAEMRGIKHYRFIYSVFYFMVLCMRGFQLPAEHTHTKWTMWIWESREYEGRIFTYAKQNTKHQTQNAYAIFRQKRKPYTVSHDDKQFCVLL